MTKDFQGCGARRAGRSVKPGKATGPGEATMTDDDLRRDVAAELVWDPQVDSTAIEVSAAGGMVTLRGTVASLSHQRAAGNAARRVRGVTGVANDLRVRIPDRDRRGDEDLRGDVLE